MTRQVERLERQLAEAENRCKTEALKHEQAAQEKTLHILSAFTAGSLEEAAGAAERGAGEESLAQGGGTVLMERLKVQQQEIDRLAAMAEERNELMRMQEEARDALEAKDRELEEVALSFSPSL